MQPTSTACVQRLLPDAAISSTMLSVQADYLDAEPVLDDVAPLWANYDDDADLEDAPLWANYDAARGAHQEAAELHYELHGCWPRWGPDFDGTTEDVSDHRARWLRVLRARHHRLGKPGVVALAAMIDALAHRDRAALERAAALSALSTDLQAEPASLRGPAAVHRLTTHTPARGPNVPPAPIHAGAHAT